jgi:DNA-binding MarR family transcriptional regulator
MGPARRGADPDQETDLTAICKADASHYLRSRVGFDIQRGEKASAGLGRTGHGSGVQPAAPGWVIMELHHVRDFVAVAEELSFTRAAEKLHVAQPSLTRKIRNLEEEIGVVLFDRSRGRLALTEPGRAFLAEAKRLLVLSAESIEVARRVSRGEIERFRIGYTDGFDYHRMPATLAAFHRVCPTVKLSLHPRAAKRRDRSRLRWHIRGA